MNVPIGGGPVFTLASSAVDMTLEATSVYWTGISDRVSRTKAP